MAPAETKPQSLKGITLPSGVNAVFYERKGDALFAAQAKAAGDESRVTFGLLTEVCEVDGKPCTMQMLEEIDMFDAMRLGDELTLLAKTHGGEALTENLPEGARSAIKLPNGEVAAFMKRKGIALINAQRKAGGEPGRVAFALLSEVVEFNGEARLMEDIEQMGLFAVMRLWGELNEMGKPGQTPKP